LVPFVAGEGEEEEEEERGLRRWFEGEFVDLLDVQWTWDFGCPAADAVYGPFSLAMLQS
jgi:hypothetical protein